MTETQLKPINTLGKLQSRNVERATGIQISDTPAKRSRLHSRLCTTWGDGTRAEWEAGQGICKVCGSEHCQPGEDMAHMELFGEPIAFPLSVCDQCAPFVTEHYQPGSNGDHDEISLTPKWDEQCPPRFKSAVDLSPPPARVDRAAMERVKAWRPGDVTDKGLYIVGASGTGKTTAFWALARALEREGITPIILSSLELSRVLQEAARDIRDVAWLTRCRVLMVDDLGKERATPAASALLWEVLDRRYSHGLPAIFTSRFPSKDLAARFGEESIGQDICRRLFEICDGVKFASSTQNHE
jgi:hypothetical protein